ncbi:MAG: PilN domain-containing protein [Tahibacter sp.]
MLSVLRPPARGPSRANRLRVCLALLASLAATVGHAAIPAVEHQVLLDLYNGTQGMQWSRHAGWQSETGTDCLWEGVRCDAELAHVVGLDLRDNQLIGALPAKLHGLTKLQSFDVSGNRLGGAIPTLQGLTVLQSFDVSHNQLAGALPALDDLYQLRQFDASHNRLTGSLPRFDGLPAGSEIRVDHNELSGAVPAPGCIARAALRPNSFSYPSADAAIDVAWNRIMTPPWWRDCQTRDPKMAATFISDKRAEIPMIADVLAELQRCLPPDITVERLGLDDKHQLEFQVIGKNVATVIATLQSSQRFTDPKLAGAVTPDVRSGQERGRVIAGLRPGSHRDGADSSQSFFAHADSAPAELSQRPVDAIGGQVDGTGTCRIVSKLPLTGSEPDTYAKVALQVRVRCTGSIFSIAPFFAALEHGSPALFVRNVFLYTQVSGYVPAGEKQPADIIDVRFNLEGFVR